MGDLIVYVGLFIGSVIIGAIVGLLCATIGNKIMKYKVEKAAKENEEENDGESV